MIWRKDHITGLIYFEPIGAEDEWFEQQAVCIDEKRHIDLLPGGDTPADESIDQAKFKNVLDQKLGEFAKSLNERESKIFQERLLSEVPLTLQAIADEYGISRERARQIEERIKSKLKTFFKQEGVNVEEHLAPA